MGMFDEEENNVLREDSSDETGMPYLTLGGVYQPGVPMSAYVDEQGKIKLRKAIIDLFTLYPVVDNSRICALADAFNISDEVVKAGIYGIMSSFFGAGKFHDNPHNAIDPTQLKMGIETEMEHTNCPVIAERIAKDHLAELPDYYSRLQRMEQI